MRHLHDPASLRAFSHRTRLRLLDLLRAGGPATVGQLSEALDEAVGSISHHLKVLEQTELVEPAPELARDRRERWWRIVPGSTGWDRRDLDPVSAAAGQAAEEVLLEHQTELFRAAIRQPARPGHTDGFATNTWLRLTDDELQALEREIVEVVGRHVALSKAHADDSDRPAPVFFAARAARVAP